MSRTKSANSEDLMSSAQTFAWRSRPLFLSGTFRDLHAERDHLRRVVFPELEERLARAQHHLEVIDLRWGVDTVSVSASTADAQEVEQAKELLVLKVCLDAVARCKPFLVVVLGDRYGWAPPAERTRQAAAPHGLGPVRPGTSITEMEIAFGLLADAAATRSAIYFREGLPYDSDTMTPESVAVHRDPPGSPAAARLAELKRELRERFPSRVRSFTPGWDAARQQVTGLEEFGRMVLEDLGRELDAETRPFARQAPRTWPDVERDALEDFVEVRNRDFVGRADAVARAEAVAHSPTGRTAEGLCVIGPQGSGKSSLFAHLLRRLRGRCLVLAHAAGISVRSARVEDLLRRWAGELTAALGEGAPGDDVRGRALEILFGDLLERAAAGRRVVLLLDALEQFEPTPQARQLAWLPRVLPANLRVIATTGPGSEAQELATRPGMACMPLAPLSADDAGNVARTFCGRARRDLNPAVLAALTARRLPDGAPATGNPLWLGLALDELSLLDGDDFARLRGPEFEGLPEDLRVQKLLCDIVGRMPPTVEGLYGWLLIRAGEASGPVLARTFVALLAVSRAGWREVDLRALLPAVMGEPWNDLRFAILRRALRAHLLERGVSGQLDFRHEQMRRSVSLAYLADLRYVRELHAAIVEHLQSLPATDPIRQGEMMYHLIGAERPDAAGAYLSGELAPAEGETAAEAMAAHLVGESGILASRLAWALTVLDHSPPGAEGRGRLAEWFLSELLSALAHRADLPTRVELVTELLQRVESWAAEAPEDVPLACVRAHTRSLHGTLIGQLQGQGSRAAEDHQAALDALAALLPLHPEDRRLTFAVALFRSRLAEALADQRATANANPEEMTASDLFTHTMTAFQAVESLQQAMEAASQLDGEARADFDFSNWMKSVELGLRTGTLSVEQALQQYEEETARREQRRSAGLDSYKEKVALVDLYGSLGQLRCVRGEAATCLDLARKRQDIVAELRQAEPDNVNWRRAWGHVRLEQAQALSSLGRPEEARQATREAVAVASELAARDSRHSVLRRDLVTVLHNAAQTALAVGDRSEGLDMAEQAWQLAEAGVLGEPTSRLWQESLAEARCLLGELLLLGKRAADALPHLEMARTLFDGFRVVSQSLQDSRQVAHVRWRLAQARRAGGDFNGAVADYQQALALFRGLASRDLRNQTLLDRWETTEGELVELFFALDVGGEALSLRRQSLHARVELHETAGDNAALLDMLARGHENLGDALLATGDVAGAEAAYQETIPLRFGLVSLDGRNGHWQAALARCARKVGKALRGLGVMLRGNKALQIALSTLDGLMAAHPENLVWEYDRVNLYLEVADIWEKDGRALALDVYRRAAALSESVLARRPADADWQAMVALSQNKVGDVLLLRLGDLEGARTHYETSVRVRENLAALEPENSQRIIDLVNSHHRLAVVHLNRKDDERTRTHFGRCRELIRAVLPAGGPLPPNLAQVLAHADEVLGDSENTSRSAGMVD
jgi:tetratricopeptide (TPR) repeat protein